MKTKIEEMKMLAFRCQPMLIDALDIVAKSNKISRSSVIRLLLLQALKDNVKPAPKKFKKGVDSTASA